MKSLMKHALLCQVLVLLAANASVADLADGLVAYWPFNDDATDASGNGNDGVFQHDLFILNGMDQSVKGFSHPA